MTSRLLFPRYLAIGADDFKRGVGADFIRGSHELFPGGMQRFNTLRLYVASTPCLLSALQISLPTANLAETVSQAQEAQFL